jgi:hypothetical protein
MNFLLIILLVLLFIYFQPKPIPTPLTPINAPETFNQFVPIEVESNDPIMDTTPVGSYLITSPEEAMGADFPRDPLESVRAKLAKLYKLPPTSGQSSNTSMGEVTAYEPTVEFTDFDNSMIDVNDTYVINQRYSIGEVKMYPIHAQYYE